MACWKCGGEVPSEAEFCPSCGVLVIRPINDSSAEEVDEDKIHELLARANLLRMRGNNKGASQYCIEVLRLAPGNATAHSLLGDIYHSEGRLRDAMEWYRLALSLDPGRKTDRDKLDEIIDRFYTTPSATINTSDEDTTAEEPVKPRLRSSILQASVIAFIVLGLAGLALILLFARLQERNPELDNSLMQESLPSVFNTPEQQPIEMPPSSSAIISTEKPVVPARPNMEEPNASVGGATQEQAASALENIQQRENILNETLYNFLAENAPNVVSFKGELDPRDGDYHLAYLCFPGQTVEETKNLVLYQNLDLCRIAATTDTQIHKLFVRAEIGFVDEEENIQSVPFFIGEVAPKKIIDTAAQSFKPEQIEQLFVNPWWNPDF